jgi:hypothetical protein
MAKRPQISPDGTLTIRESAGIWRGLFGAFAGLMLFFAIRNGLQNGLGKDVYGALLGAAVFTLGVFAFPAGTVRFAPTLRRIVWKRTQWCKTRVGELNFDDVTNVEVQRLSDGDGDSFRPVLQVRSGLIKGDLLPLREAYGPPLPAQETVDVVRQLLGLRAPSHEERVTELARNGQKLQAIRLARETMFSDLKRAKDYVEKLGAK